MLRKLLLISTITLITACLRLPQNEHAGNVAAQLIYQSPTVIDLTSGMLREGLYEGEIIAEKGSALVNVNIMEAPQIRQMYLNYCNAWGGILERPYVPDGFSSTAADGFREQMVFFHKSKAGRSEFEFCTVNRVPLFAVTAAGRSAYYLLEGDALLQYIDQQKKMLISIAEEAKKAHAFYSSDKASETGGYALTKANLLSYTSRPVLMAEFNNPTQDDAIVPINSEMVLLIDHQQYYFRPAYAGGDRIDASLRNGKCEMNRSNTAMLLPKGSTCSVIVAFDSDADIKKLPAARASLYFAGHALTMTPKSEYDTGDSKVWLKPRLDRR